MRAASFAAAAGVAALVVEEQVRGDVHVEHVLPGRWGDARQPNEGELKATMIIALPIDEASAKIRTGPPADAKDDLPLPVWAGVIPFELMRGDPLADNEAPVPGYLERFLAG